MKLSLHVNDFCSDWIPNSFGSRSESLDKIPWKEGRCKWRLGTRNWNAFADIWQLPFHSFRSSSRAMDRPWTRLVTERYPFVEWNVRMRSHFHQASVLKGALNETRSLKQLKRVRERKLSRSMSDHKLPNLAVVEVIRRLLKSPWVWYNCYLSSRSLLVWGKETLFGLIWRLKEELTFDSVGDQ